MTEKRSMKHRGEDAAAAYLERVGITVIERSWKSEAGVIDVLAWDGDTLVIVDVKTRAASQAKGGLATMTPAKVRRVRRLAKAYLEYADLHNVRWRYDQVELLVIADDRALLRHHRDALSV